MNLPGSERKLVVMMKRRTSLLVVMMALAAPQLAQAQSADLVLCDRLAADPSDPDKPADIKGVAEVAAADVATAIKYCAIAAKSSRLSGRRECTRISAKSNR